MAIGLSKRWLRQLTYLAVLATSMLLFVGVVDLMFKNVLPPLWHNIIPYQGNDLILQDLVIKECGLFNKNCQLDGYRRYEADLRLGSSWTKANYLFTKITSPTDHPLESLVVVDIHVSNTTSGTPEYILTDIGSVELKLSGWRYYDYGIWLKYGEFVKGYVINEVEVLFGPDCVDPRPNWTLIKTPLQMESSPGLEPYLTYRKGTSSELVKPVLKIRKDSKFKILQVADLHFSTGVGVCRDPFPASSGVNCEADPRTLRFLDRVLDLEKPDFVVLTGDQIFGETTKDSKTTLLKSVAPFIKRKIPYAMVMGNHDDEGSMTREQVMLLAASLPYSLTSLGPEDIDGVGNYQLSVELSLSRNPAMSLWFLDSHKYSQSPKTNPGYDWLKGSQINWLQLQYDEHAEERKLYTHIHLSMAFFHIPLPEYTEVKDHVVVGDIKEAVTAPRYNSGAYETLKRLGVSVLSVGHDHCNDYCLLNDFWLCYGGAIGEGGYAGYGGTQRRVRVFEVDTQRNDIRSWKRLENDPDTVKDSQLLVSGGSVLER